MEDQVIENGIVTGAFWLSGWEAQDSLSLLEILPWDKQEHCHRSQ